MMLDVVEHHHDRNEDHVARDGDDTAQQNDANEVFLFSTTFDQLSVRSFKGQSSAPVEAGFSIKSNDVEMFKQKRWDVVSGRFKREVKFESDDSPRWVPVERHLRPSKTSIDFS